MEFQTPQELARGLYGLETAMDLPESVFEATDGVVLCRVTNNPPRLILTTIAENGCPTVLRFPVDRDAFEATLVRLKQDADWE